MTHRLKERMLQPRGLSLVHQQPSCPSKGNQVTLLRRFARRSCNLKPFGLYTSAVSIGSLLRGAGWARRYRHLDKPTRTKVQFLSAIMLQIAVRHIKGQRKAPSRRSLGQLGWSAWNDLPPYCRHTCGIWAVRTHPKGECSPNGDCTGRTLAKTLEPKDTEAFCTRYLESKNGSWITQLEKALSNNSNFNRCGDGRGSHQLQRGPPFEHIIAICT